MEEMKDSEIKAEAKKPLSALIKLSEGLEKDRTWSYPFRHSQTSLDNHSRFAAGRKSKYRKQRYFHIAQKFWASPLPMDVFDFFRWS